MPQTVAGCIYPTNAEMMAIQMELFPRYLQGRLGLEILPFQTVDSARILIAKPDIFRGLQQWRGLDKPTESVDGSHNYYGSLSEILPGYWGEHIPISERFLTEGGNLSGCMTGPIDLSDYVTRQQQWLLERRANRIEHNIWQVLTTGSYVALNSQGQIMFQASYDIRNVSAAIPWSDPLNSTPLADLRCIQLFGRGTSTDFGSCARMYMNRVTLNCLLSNRNPNDLGRHALSACCEPMSLDVVTGAFQAQGLPLPQVYDQGYVDDAGNFHTYIPDGKIVIVGCRPGGARVGHYFYTRNAVDCSISSGPWQKIVDNCAYAVPREILVFDGHNGGPGLEYPRAIVTMDTGCSNVCP